MVTPKRENMDGHSFEQWRFEVDKAITKLASEAYSDKGDTMVAMFNTNHDATTAARAWLRAALSRAP
ncbi:MAG TPA: hypothetical protein VGR45_02650 [Stellaceae bacterium]|nr:hypothetical protein [Stellaceae bacterium]